MLDLADLQAKLSPRTAAVFLENPAYLGAFEPRAKEIMDLAHQAGAIGIVMPEVSSLGVVTPPPGYGSGHHLRRHSAPGHSHAVRQRLRRLHRHGQ